MARDDSDGACDHCKGQFHSQSVKRRLDLRVDSGVSKRADASPTNRPWKSNSSHGNPRDARQGTTREEFLGGLPSNHLTRWLKIPLVALTGRAPVVGNRQSTSHTALKNIAPSIEHTSLSTTSDYLCCMEHCSEPGTSNMDC